MLSKFFLSPGDPKDCCDLALRVRMDLTSSGGKCRISSGSLNLSSGRFPNSRMHNWNDYIEQAAGPYTVLCELWKSHEKP